MKSTFLILPLLLLSILFSCSRKNNQSLSNATKPDNTGIYPNESKSSVAKDTSSLQDKVGRKIVYRDLTASKKAMIDGSGRVVIRTCINRDGIVTSAEIIPEKTTIKDQEVLELYLKSARGYRFEPKADAPEVECGSLAFSIDNNVKAKYIR